MAAPTRHKKYSYVGTYTKTRTLTRKTEVADLAKYSARKCAGADTAFFIFPGERKKKRFQSVAFLLHLSTQTNRRLIQFSQNQTICTCVVYLMSYLIFSCIFHSTGGVKNNDNSKQIKTKIKTLKVLLIIHCKRAHVRTKRPLWAEPRRRARCPR